MTLFVLNGVAHLRQLASYLSFDYSVSQINLLPPLVPFQLIHCTIDFFTDQTLDNSYALSVLQITSTLDFCFLSVKAVPTAQAQATFYVNS